VLKAERQGNGANEQLFRTGPRGYEMHIDWSLKHRLSPALVALGLLAGVPCAKGDFQTASMPEKIFTRAMDELDLAETIQGDVFRGSSGTLNMLEAARLAGLSSFVGNDHPLADQDVVPVGQASDLAFSTPLSDPSNAPKWIRLRDQSLTLTFSQNTVLNLTNFVLIHGTLTLEGTTGTMITINVRNRFSLLHSSKVVLSGGLQPSDVIFNILGRGREVVIRRRSSLTGTLQAPHRTVRMQNHSIVFGYVMAKRIILRGGSKIIPPPIVSP
jgi:hypothetical protein